MTPVLLALALLGAPAPPEAGPAAPATPGAALAAPAPPATAPAPSATAPPAPEAAPALSPEDREAARIAWTYFERNLEPATGLVRSVDGYPSTTLWDLGSSLLATVAARRLGLLPQATFDDRVTRMLRTVAGLPLFHGELPNKAYDARTGAMTDYANEPAPEGIGFSALDVGRFVAAMEVLARAFPAHAPEAARVVERWDLCRLSRGGELQGAVIAGGGTQLVQEGRLGYEQYAAHALARLGLDVPLARRYDRFVAEETISGVRVRRDARERRTHGAVDALVTDPWVLHAIELGGEAGAAPLLDEVFEVQKARWRTTGTVTAAGEDHVDRAPWFVYDAIWADGAPWRTVTAEGAPAPGLRGVSTKAAFALAALRPDDPYAAVLLDAVRGARDPARGWFAGVYEGGAPNRSVNANTNGVVLEAILYRVAGPLAPDVASPLAPGDGASPLRAAAARALGRCEAEPVVAASVGLRAPAGGLDVPTAASGAGLGPTPASFAARPPGPRPFRVDGTVYGGWRGMDRGLAGAVATLWPWRYGFLRLGGESTPASPDGTSRLLWGFGWDDWHDRTFFLHVDNWGPIRPRDGLAIRQAELNAGYRLPRLCAARWLCLSPVAGLTAPFQGGPYLSGRVHVTVANDWFVMGGLGWTVPGSAWRGPEGTPGWRVVYGFGRWSWKPGSVFLTYYDWGPNSRSGNGILALGMNWGF